MVAKTHVSACADSAENMRLKGIMSRSNERARILAVDASSITGEEVSVYESVADIAADSEIDFVVIATPPNVRAELIAPLAAAGKHILLEKPSDVVPSRCCAHLEMDSSQKRSLECRARRHGLRELQLAP
jgi:predicted dehydrogenase